MGSLCTGYSDGESAAGWESVDGYVEVLPEHAKGLDGFPHAIIAYPRGRGAPQGWGPRGRVWEG